MTQSTSFNLRPSVGFRTTWIVLSGKEIVFEKVDVLRVSDGVLELADVECDNDGAGAEPPRPIASASVGGPLDMVTATAQGWSWWCLPVLVHCVDRPPRYR
jgi:hypothetical protein